MRRKLTTAVMNEFQRLMEEKLPEFSLIHAEAAKRELLFERAIGANLAFFIRAFAYPGREEFNVQLAWSEQTPSKSSAEFPRHIHPGMQPHDPPDAGGVCFALHWLKENPGNEVLGWNFAPDPDVYADVEEWLKPPPTVEDLLPKVSELVGEAMEALLQLGMPYFERVLAERNTGH